MPAQVEDFLQKAQQVVSPADAPPPQQNEPRVPFQTALRLDAAQEKRLIDHAFTRLTTLNSELGRDQTLAPNWWQNQTGGSNALASQGLLPSDTFLGKRSRYDATFLNDVSWRPFTYGPDSIFNSSNLATPVVRRVCRQMIARAKNSFFGSEPWFSVDPAPVPEFDPQNDAERADRIEKFCRFKLREADSKDDKGRAISRALILGECAVKTSYVVRDQMFNVEARVLHSVEGEPLRAADGNHITEADAFVDAEDGTGRRVLARDKITEEPLAPIWQNVPLNRRQVLFEGAKSEPIYFKDFLCPLTATDVQEADCVVHLYDKPVMAFVDLVVKRGMVGDDVDGRMDAARKMVALVKDLSNNSPQPKAAVNQGVRPNDGYASPPSVETGGPIAEFAEFYLWYDANGDGVAENIMLICDRNTRAPIFYDHVANVTTDGLRPIEIVRINPVEGRWYGMGIMELFDSYQVTIDLLVNRWNFSQSSAGRVILWTPNNTLEGDLDPNLKMNFGGTYTKKQGMKKEDVVEVVYINDLKFDQIQTMFQFFLQLLMNESGVSSANDDQAAGMQSAKLATGILEVTKSGDELFRPVIMDLKGPLERILNREIDVILANMNPQEVYDYLEGDTRGIDTLTPDDVRGLKFKTNITLTTDRNQEKLQVAAAASALVEKFYMLPPEIQMRVAGFYKAQLRSLDPTCEVDSVIVAMPPMMGAPQGEGGGTGVKLGVMGDNTQFSTQLGQKTSQQEGVSAPGGTPKAA
jgi:hypothetical protein